MESGLQIEVLLAGPVRVLRADGTDLTPAGAKARGLLALVGSAPGMRRARSWLQDKLWSDRGPEQGAASLRQVLVELRRALGDSRDCLLTEGGMVGLDPRRVSVMIEPGPADWGPTGDAAEFAEGLNVADPEFDDWIRERRLAFADRLEHARIVQSSPLAVAEPAPAASPVDAVPAATRMLADAWPRYDFDAFQLDLGQYQLRRGGETVHVEPMVFDLLRLFVENPGAVVDRDRMIAEVWGGRSVSDATLATAIKSARRALGDSGAEQALIETVRGRGFRFRGQVSGPPAAMPVTPDPGALRRDEVSVSGGAPSIAVLPFVRLGGLEPFGGLEEAIPHDMIQSLSRLRWLFVIASGSSFRFRGPDADVGLVGRSLGARYCLTGMVEVTGRTLAVDVELSDTRSGGVVWGERFSAALDDVHRVRGEIVDGITVALEGRIQLNEALQAQDRPPENLDAWQAFHLGLKHVHQYTEAGNAAALALFDRAVRLEPGFARAHAGLSFAHFQNAFMRYLPDREGEMGAARASAERGLELDPLDPFANFNMGRSFWLAKDLDATLPWLERATGLSPNFAQGIYTHALMDALSGRSALGRRNAELAMALSPLDPLLYAMRASKALISITDGDYAEAARWAEAAARTPRAHVIIEMIATFSNTLAGRPEMARQWAASVRRRKPDATRQYFFDALPVQHADSRARIAGALAEHGF